MSTWVIIPSDDDVMHKSHKYIEKVRTTKGGWRYIYKKPKYKTNSKNSFGLEERKKMKEAEKATEEAKNTHANNVAANEVARKNRMNSNLTEEQKKKASENAVNRINESRQNVKKAEFDENRAFENYRTTKLGKLESSAKAGIQIIGDFIKTFPDMASTKISYLLNGTGHDIKVKTAWKRGKNYTPPYKAEDASKYSVKNNKKSMTFPYSSVPVVTPKNKKRKILT